MTLADDTGEDTAAPVELVGYEQRGPVAWLTLQRPDKLNALSMELMTGLSECLRRAENDDSVRVVVLTGNDRVFSVGYDIAEEVEMGVSRAEQWHAGLTHNVGLSMQVWSLTKPMIGAVSGWALAGACELALACDLIVASDNARFGEPEIRFGSGPVTLLIPFVLGQKKTNELLFTGDVVDAETALQLGLVNRVVPITELQSTVQRLAEKIALTPLPVLRFTKIAINRAYEAMGLRNAVNANLDVAAILNGAQNDERAVFTELVATKGLRAALDWRDARYAPYDN